MEILIVGNVGIGENGGMFDENYDLREMPPMHSIALD